MWREITCLCLDKPPKAYYAIQTSANPWKCMLFLAPNEPT